MQLVAREIHKAGGNTWRRKERESIRGGAMERH
jgi:hypothetical protein